MNLLSNTTEMYGMTFNKVRDAAWWQQLEKLRLLYLTVRGGTKSSQELVPEIRRGLSELAADSKELDPLGTQSSQEIEEALTAAEERSKFLTKVRNREEKDEIGL